MKTLPLIAVLVMPGCGDELPSMLGTWRLDLESSATCIIEISGQGGFMYNWDLSRSDSDVYGKAIDCPDANGVKFRGEISAEERSFRLASEGHLFGPWTTFTGHIAEGNRYISGKMASAEGLASAEQITTQTFKGNRIKDGNP